MMPMRCLILGHDWAWFPVVMRCNITNGGAIACYRCGRTP